MTDGDINGHARRLLEAYGPKARAIAAQKARRFEDENDAAQAATWRRIESILVDMRRDTVG